ncbi:unnamed protein product [Spirodela intermedia]|uniref:Uncharacterized protein n=2 Tax=Spirodela intermedia TaxID=51605 RepID=A0A7I8KCM5_SPIIN|nr:unnamed protein product [Spirodela intermedia]CAA6658948.1 unnamed protein product [Spirodela intermedia]CAA7395232.1 unnamed protein product [Spirodela intermedia]
MGDCEGKSSWPELVGYTGIHAAAIIENQNHLVDAIIVKEGSSVPLDYRCNRVWVWVNKLGIVFKTPIIG